MYGVGPQFPGQANQARQSVADPFGPQIVEGDIRRHVLQERACRLNQSEMRVEARAIPVPQKQYNYSFGTPTG